MPARKNEGPPVPATVRPDARTQAGALWDALADCHRRVRAELRVVVRRHGIYLSEYRALARLREGSRNLTELAESLGLTPASMTDLARQLVERGWVVRLAHPHDRRSQLLQVTPTGSRVYAATRGEYRGRLFEVYSELPAESQKALPRGLDVLSGVLRRREETRLVHASAAAAPIRPPAASSLKRTRGGGGRGRRTVGA